MQWILELHVTSFNCWFLPLLMLNAKCDSEQDENGRNAANEKFQTALTIELASRIVAPQKVHETMRKRESCNRHTFGTHFCIRWSRAFFSAISLFLSLRVSCCMGALFHMILNYACELGRSQNSPFPCIFICVADLLLALDFFRSFPSLHASSSMPNIKSLVYNTCVHHMRESLCWFSVSKSSSRNTWSAHMISLFIYLVLVRWCAKVHSWFFFVSFLLFLFICVNVRVLFAPCLSFPVQSIRNGKGRSNNNANAKKRTEEHSVMGIGGKIMNEINLHRQLFFYCGSTAAKLWLHTTLFGSSTLFIWLFSLLILFCSVPWAG